MRIKVALITAVMICLLLFGSGVSARSQQPRNQAPVPDSCARAMRENAAYRDRIAALERQIDQTEEEGKIYYLRAATFQDAYFNAMRLAAEYSTELVAVRNENAELRATIADLIRQQTRPVIRRRK